MGFGDLTGKWTYRRDKILLPSIIAFSAYIFFIALNFFTTVFIFRTYGPTEGGEIYDRIKTVRNTLLNLLPIFLGFVGSYFSYRRRGENSELIVSGVLPVFAISTIFQVIYVLAWLYPVAFYGPTSAEYALEQMRAPGLSTLLSIIGISLWAFIGAGITIGIKRWKEK